MKYPKDLIVATFNQGEYLLGFRGKPLLHHKGYFTNTTLAERAGGGTFHWNRVDDLDELVYPKLFEFLIANYNNLKESHD